VGKWNSSETDLEVFNAVADALEKGLEEVGASRPMSFSSSCWVVDVSPKQLFLE